MTLTSPRAATHDSMTLLDRRLAYLLLRLTFGINMLLHGAVRLPALKSPAIPCIWRFYGIRPLCSACCR
jgi:hypothetical protein